LIVSHQNQIRPEGYKVWQSMKAGVSALIWKSLILIISLAELMAEVPEKEGSKAKK
jgi:hypothetical protein